MIPKYIEDWLKIIETMSNQNTYKLAWGRALIEYVNTNDIDLSKEKIEIDLLLTAEIVLKYYWNQLFFFNLKQSPDSSKANIIDIVYSLINKYKELIESAIPKWFIDGKKVLENTKEYKKALNDIRYLLKVNPVTYFRNSKIENSNRVETLPIYEIDYPNNKVILNTSDCLLLKEYGVLLSRLLNYKWTQLLEKYNYVPKISGKVSAISDETIKRNSLKEYKEELLKLYKEGKIIDFYTGKELSYDDVSIDHVIPWSFMYSDDIWNLVITSKSNNSSKSNRIVENDIIEKLKKQNELLLNVVSSKYKEELKNAIENDYLDKYYYECKVAK